MGGYFGGKGPLGKPRNRWGNTVWREAADLLQVLDWKAAARMTGGCRKEIGEAIVRKRKEEE
jgi:hypothetical protein